MIALYIIMSIFILLFLAAILPVSLTLKYSDDVTLYASVLMLKFQLHPKKKKKTRISDYSQKKLERQRKRALRKRHKRKKDALGQKSQSQKQIKEKKQLLENLGLIHELLSTFISGIIKYVRIKTTKIIINVATDDAAKTALLYAAVKNAVLVILTFLDNCKKIDKLYNSEISVNADFLSEKSSADVEISFSLRVWHMI